MQQGPMDSTGSYMLCNDLYVKRASLLAQMVKNLPSMQETWVQSLGWNHLMEKGILQYSCLDNYMDRGAWWATVHRVAKSQNTVE